MTFQRKCSPAFLTDKRSISRVYTRVRYKVVFQCERLFTFATLVWSIRTMEKQMSMKTMLVCETLAAVNTDMRSFSGVYPCVCCKVMLKKKRLPTFGARVWPFFRYTDLTSHILLLFHFRLDLSGINMS